MTVLGEVSDNPFQYTGRENDGTGLYYYRARYYSPDLQRFISEDPIRFDGGDVNFYAYVGNNPIRFMDPFGLMGVNPPEPPEVFIPPAELPCGLQSDQYCNREHRKKIEKCFLMEKGSIERTECFIQADLWLKGCLKWNAGIAQRTIQCPPYPPGCE